MLTTIRRRGRHRAVYVAEFALVCPIVLACLFGCLEWCRYVMTRNQAENAVREGARYAVCRTDIDQTGTTAQDIVQVVQNYLAPIGGSLTNMQVYVYQVNSAGQPIDLNGNVISQAQAIQASNEANWYQTPFGSGICVTMTATYAPLAHELLLMNATLPMQITAVMNSEGN